MGFQICGEPRGLKEAASIHVKLGRNVVPRPLFHVRLQKRSFN